MVSRRNWRAGAAVTAAIGLAVVGISPAAADVPEESFADGPGAWVAYGHDGDIDTSSGSLCVDVPAGSAQYGVGVLLNGVAVEAGSTYTLGFSASATSDVTIRALVGQNGAPYGTVVDQSPGAHGGPHRVLVRVHGGRQLPRDRDAGRPRGADRVPAGRLQPRRLDVLPRRRVAVLRRRAAPAHVVRRVARARGASTAARTPSSPTAASARPFPAVSPTRGTRACRSPACPIEEGQNYVLSFTASASADTPVRVIVGEGGGAYRTTFEQAAVPLTSELATYTYPFTANLSFPADGTAPGQLAFHLGKTVGYDFCISDVSLRTTASPPPPYEPETGPRVRVNQVGLRPRGAQARDAGLRGRPRRCRGSCTTPLTPSSRRGPPRPRVSTSPPRSTCTSSTSPT